MINTVMKYRSRTDIIVSILEAARLGQTKTKIMYSSFLSSHQLRTYLELVISHGLLDYHSAKGRYRTTERGLRLLDLYNNVSRLELPRVTNNTSTQKQEKRYYASHREKKEMKQLQDIEYMPQMRHTLCGKIIIMTIIACLH